MSGGTALPVERFRAAFARAAPSAQRDQSDVVEAHPSRPRESGAPWAGSVRADAAVARARAHYVGVASAEWRDGATLEEWAVAYLHADGMRAHDPVASLLHGRIEDEVRRRFAVDVRSVLESRGR